MKNHELLDMIGDVNEDYVLEAGNNVAKPRFRWKALAACAACAALVLAAYPAFRWLSGAGLADVDTPREPPELHAYTVVEGGGTQDTQQELKAPANGADMPAPDPDPAQPPRGDGPDPIPGGGDAGWQDIDGTGYSVPGQDTPAQEEAMAQYQGLLQGLSGQGGNEPETYPEWFGGAWLDNDWPDNTARLTVAIVDGFRTPELEAQILDWCGGTGDVLFCGAKYSYDYLNSLMEPVPQVLDGTGISCGIGVDVAANCLGVDLYGDGKSIPDSILAELARLDPDGDAIRVRVFTQAMSTLTDEVKKGPAQEPAAPVPDEKRAEPNTEPNPAPVENGADAVPGGARPVEDLPETKEDSQQARYDLLPLDGSDDMPENQYDAIAEEDLLGGADGLPGYGLLY